MPKRRRLEGGEEYAGPMVSVTLYDGNRSEIMVEDAEEPITLSLSLAGGERAGDGAHVDQRVRAPDDGVRRVPVAPGRRRGRG